MNDDKIVSRICEKCAYRVAFDAGICATINANTEMAIREAISLTRAETLEEAAKVCETPYKKRCELGWYESVRTGIECATEIRRLSSPASPVTNQTTEESK